MSSATTNNSAVGLCLSGGGFRSALFHLGALRRLNELGVLSKIDTVSSVSGGSVLAAHLAQRINPWPQSGDVFPDWESQVAEPFKALARQNLRTWPLIKRWLRPWKWFHSGAAIDSLARKYEKELTTMRIPGLPERPRFVFCSTDMVFGVNWVFERARVGDYQAGYAEPAPDWPVAKAVAASSCFPPVFGPMPLRDKHFAESLRGGRFQSKERRKLLSRLRLTDGGVYDNLGLEPVWGSHAVVLVSDGGAPFGPNGSTKFFGQLMRYLDITGNQGSATRKRWLISKYLDGSVKGAYWGLRSATANYPNQPKGYPAELVEEVIATVRTDFDAFSEAEMGVLENQGYLVAEAGIQGHASHLIEGNPVPLQIPHPEWMDADLVRKALKNSGKTKILGRGWLLGQGG